MNELYRTLLRCLLPVSAAAFLLLPSSAQAEKGMLRIVTEPGDAQIMIDGKLKGNSPSEVGQSFAIKLDEGEYMVQAVKKGNTGILKWSIDQKVFVANDTMQNLMLKLVPIPEMINVPAGEFDMGCQGTDQLCDAREKPSLHITIPAFEIGKYEVTFEMWDACVAQGGCGGYRPDDESGGRGNQPVTEISWFDAQAFITWLNQKSGSDYRLPSEPEWEYAARSGTTTVYPWGDVVGNNNANCDGCGSRWAGQQTAPVGSFPANSWGIHDMNGNVREWVFGCNWTYEGSSSDEKSWKVEQECGGRVARGGHFSDTPKYVRSSDRSFEDPSVRMNGSYQGFRLAK